MAKVPLGFAASLVEEHFSGITKRLPFEDLDFYDLFRIMFENSELGRMKRLLPLHEMAVNFGLVSNRVSIHPLFRWSKI